MRQDEKLDSYFSQDLLLSNANDCFPSCFPLESKECRVTDMSLQFDPASDRQFTVPVTVARSCEKTIPDTGEDDTSMIC